MGELAVQDLVGDRNVEALTAREVVELMLERLHPRVALACSFQKEESVLLHMLLGARSDARVFALDTHVLFPETYANWRAVEERYGITVEVHQGPSLGRQAAEHGEALWERDAARCCDFRKVGPLNEALAGLEGWITGMRREQSPTRADAPKIEWDAKHGLWKANPLADWTEDQVWDYIREHDLPVNQLHYTGYASIGCTHCTKPGGGREGRWAGLDKTECGLHL